MLCRKEPVQCYNIGRVIKNTKRRFIWSFTLHQQGQSHHDKCFPVTVMLNDSTVSGKRTLEVNSTEVKWDTGRQFAETPIILLISPELVTLRRTSNSRFDVYVGDKAVSDIQVDTFAQRLEAKEIAESLALNVKQQRLNPAELLNFDDLDDNSTDQKVSITPALKPFDDFFNKKEPTQHEQFNFDFGDQTRQVKSVNGTLSEENYPFQCKPRFSGVTQTTRADSNPFDNFFASNENKPFEQPQTFMQSSHQHQPDLIQFSQANITAQLKSICADLQPKPLKVLSEKKVDDFAKFDPFKL